MLVMLLSLISGCVLLGSSVLARSRYLGLSYSKPPDDVVIASLASPSSSYIPNPNHQLRCSWNSTQPSLAPQDSLLLSQDVNTLVCVLLDATKNPGDYFQEVVSKQAVDKLNGRIFFDNGTTKFNFSLQKQELTTAARTYSVWSAGVNRSSLNSPPRTTYIPWHVVVIVYEPYSRGSPLYHADFSIIDPTSDVFLGWDFGPPANPSFDGAFRPFLIRNPCASQVALVVAMSSGDVYFGKSWSLNGINISTWQKGLTLPGCSLTGVTTMVRHVILHTACGAFISNSLSSPSFSRTVNFARASALDNYVQDPGASVSNWCYLTAATVKAANYLTGKNAAGYSGISAAPFVTSVSPIFSYTGWQTDQRPGGAARARFFQTAQSDPSKIVATYLKPTSNVYFVLYKNPDGMFEVFIQSLTDMQNSVPNGRSVYKFPNDSGFVPVRFVAHPANNLLYAVGNQIWLYADDGRSFRKIHALPSLNDSVTEVLFPENYALMVIRSSSVGYFIGSAFDGFFLPVTCGNSSTNATRVMSSNSRNELFLFDITNSSSIIPCDYSSAKFSLSGSLSVVPFTSTMFYLVDWVPDSNFTTAFLGRRVVHANTDGTVDSGTVLSYLSKTELKTRFPATSPTGMLLVEMDSAPRLPADLDPQNATQKDLTVTFATDNSSGVTFALSGGGSLATFPQYSAVVAEKSSAAGTIGLRGVYILTDPTNAKGIIFGLPKSGVASAAFAAGEWKIWGFTSTATGSSSSWSIQDDPGCPYELAVNGSRARVLNLVLDRGEIAILSVTLRRTSSPRTSRGHPEFLPNDIIHDAGGSPRLHVSTSLTGNYWDGWNLVYTVEETGSVSQTDYNVAVLTFRMTRPSLACQNSMIVVSIASGCAKGSSLGYVYPDGMSLQEYTNPTLVNKMGDPVLGQLPVNYRTPSDGDGIDFPTSPNVYNADPSQPVKRYFGPNPDQYPAILKQCANASSRTDCKCTPEMRTNMAAANTDCIQQVVYLPYPGDHIFQFRLYTDYRDAGLLSSSDPILITEVNNRTDFSVALPDKVDNSTLGYLRAYYPQMALYVSNTTIRFNGTGLYHFQATTLTMVSYCNLSTEFMFFLYKPPLSFPMGQVCQCATLLAVSVWLFFALRGLGASTLMDRKRRLANRPPDTIPLEDVNLKSNEIDT